MYEEEGIGRRVSSIREVDDMYIHIERKRTLKGSALKGKMSRLDRCVQAWGDSLTTQVLSRNPLSTNSFDKGTKVDSDFSRIATDRKRDGTMVHQGNNLPRSLYLTNQSRRRGGQCIHVCSPPRQCVMSCRARSLGHLLLVCAGEAKKSIPAESVSGFANVCSRYFFQVLLPQHFEKYPSIPASIPVVF